MDSAIWPFLADYKTSTGRFLKRTDAADPAISSDRPQTPAVSFTELCHVTAIRRGAQKARRVDRIRDSLVRIHRHDERNYCFVYASRIKTSRYQTTRLTMPHQASVGFENACQVTRMRTSQWLARPKRSSPRPVKSGGRDTYATPQQPNDEQLSSLPNMPKALPAVGLAACTLQLIDFATKVLLKGHEIYQPRVGSGVQNAPLLRAVTYELCRLTDALQEHRSKKTYHEKKTGRLEEATQQLLKLSESTQEIVVQLVDGLSLAQAKCEGVESTWTNLREPLMTVWTKGAITAQKKRQQLQRRDIELALLRALKCVEASEPCAP
jgi:hypothetical protein